MKVIFSGPSLTDALRAATPAGIVHRGPAACGDVLSAVDEGATVIGLIDGVFGSIAAVWHKEILHALAEGVRVAGGGSMGALRAAECDAFGMVGIGLVYTLYRDGTLVDDAAVAQIHAPAELGHAPLSEAAVIMTATLDGLAAEGLITADEHRALARASDACPFEERTPGTIVRRATLTDARREAIATLLKHHRIDPKRADALAVVQWVADQPDARVRPPTDWTFQSTSQFRALRASIGRS